MLCFIASKYGKTTLKELKNIVSDFYSVENLSTAKLRLAEDIDRLNLSTKRPHVPVRRDGDGRLLREVEDITALFMFADEQKVIDKLPTYVVDSPDKLPSVRLYDGDLQVLVTLLRNMDGKLLEFGSTLTAITRDVRGLQQQVSRPEPSYLCIPPPPVRCDVNKNAATAAAVAVHGNSAPVKSTVCTVPTEIETIATTLSAVPDWASLASTPCQNRFAVLSIDDNDQCGNNQDEFTTVQRRSKRPRQGSAQQQPKQQSERKARAPTVRGKAAANDKIKAAKIFRKKAVFCIKNVDSECSVNDIRSFASSLSVEVISCFEVKPRRRRNDDDPDRKAFRLCIREDDCDRLLNDSAWPDSVTVSEWYFKPQDPDKRRRITAEVAENGRSPRSSTRPSDNSRSTTAADDAIQPSASVIADATSAVATDHSSASASTDGAGCSAMSDDDTILSEFSHNNGI